MINYKRGDERIMRVCDINCGRVSWACEGEVVRCRDCRHCDIGACFVRSQHPVLVPEDGFCHLGERARIHQIERNGQ